MLVRRALSRGYSVLRNIEMNLKEPLSEQQWESEYKRIHPYCNLFPWKSQKEFAENLVENVVYNKNGLVAINRPYGIALKKHDESSEAQHRSHALDMAPVGFCPYTVESSLPLIRSFLQIPTLSVSKSVERYASGIVLLAASPDVDTRIKKALRRAKGESQPPFLYQLVLIGIPVPSIHSERIGLQVQKLKKETKVVILQDFSKNDVKSHEVKPVLVNYEVVAQSTRNLASLVELSCTSAKAHFLRRYAAHQLAPVLGDFSFGKTVKTAMGIRFQSEDGSDGKLSSKELVKQLELTATTERAIPAHIHLHKVLLPGFNGKKSNPLVISANPPQHFQWSCFQLQMSSIK